MFTSLLYILHSASFFVHQTIVILNLSCHNRINQSDKQLTFRIYCTKFPHISVLKEYLSAVRISQHVFIPYNFPLFLPKEGFMN